MLYRDAAAVTRRSSMSIRILLIDDNALDREIAARALCSLAAPLGPPELVYTGTWAEARRVLRDGGLDLMLLDFHLPDLNGLDVLRELASVPHPPVVMLTGHNDLATAIET